MTEKTITVTNPKGIHARPSASITAMATQFSSEITISSKNAVANAKSIMELMMLAAAHGTRVTIRANGDDEEKAVKALCSLFKNNFNDI